MTKQESVIKYYMICQRLKNVMRTGWENWHVDAKRIESVAEHVYGTLMLAIAMKSEYEEDFKNIDLKRVLYMLAIHEVGETTIGDITQFEMSKEEKKKIEVAAVHKILSGLNMGDEIETLWQEFDNHSSEDALFAHFIDKLECDIQAKIYDEVANIDLSKQDDNISFNNELVQELLFKEYQDDKYKWSKMWLEFGRRVYHYSKPFEEISNYVSNNDIVKGDE